MVYNTSNLAPRTKHYAIEYPELISHLVNSKKQSPHKATNLLIRQGATAIIISSTSRTVAQILIKESCLNTASGYPQAPSLILKATPFGYRARASQETKEEKVHIRILNSSLNPSQLRLDTIEDIRALSQARDNQSSNSIVSFDLYLRTPIHNLLYYLSPSPPFKHTLKQVYQELLLRQ